MSNKQFVTVRCHYDPRGDHGLEGFQLNDVYKACLHERANGSGYFWRVWPDAKDKYYETCTPAVFKRYFTVVAAEEGEATP